MVRPGSALKTYVEVHVEFREDGRMRPVCLIWEDGRVYEIDRVLDVRPAAAERSGGRGDRYTVRVNGRDTYLFFEHGIDPGSRIVGRWFVERRAYRRPAGE